MTHHRLLMWNGAANSLCDVRGERVVLSLAISHEMGQDTHWTFAPVVFTFDVAGICCPCLILGILGEEHHQLCPALESVKNPCWGRSGRAGKGTRVESAIEGEMRWFR
jgi:hypothetical protein